MRIKIVRDPTISEVDGVSLGEFKSGFYYSVATVIGAYLIAQGWAELVSEFGLSDVKPATETAGLPDRRRQRRFGLVD